MSAMRCTMLLAILVWQLLLPVQAQELLMTRSIVPFPEAMLALQDSIRDHGYTLSHVQRVDIGLTGMGYKTDKYRLVFFGKSEEVRMLLEAVPDLIPYLPQNISIFAEGEQTILVTANPLFFAEIAADQVDPVIFQRWESDMRSILHDVSMAR